MNAPTGQAGSTGSPATTAVPGPVTTAVPTARTGEDPYTVHTDAMRPVSPPTPHEPARAASTAPPARTAQSGPRTVRVRTASIIATVTFLLGLGVSMLVGPLGGPPSGGPGGPGGQGGDPGTSQSTQQGTGT